MELQLTLNVREKYQK